MQPVAQAALALSNGASLTFDSMDPVSFYLYDLDGNGSATLSAGTVSVGGNPVPDLEYSTDGTYFSTLTTSTTVNYAEGANLAQVFFRLNPTNGNASSTEKGDVTFQNYNIVESAAENLDLFHALYVDWDSGQFTVTFTSSDDRFSPVPIPASALLLVSGLIGLVGFRRQMKNR
jgi:hypothetical protein